MRRAYIQPVSIIDKEADKLGAVVKYYDLIDQCEVKWSLFGDYELHSDVMKIPTSVIPTWGTDDKIIIEAVASAKNLTITGWIEPPAPGPTGAP